MMLPDILDQNSMYVFVFGPGFGECIAVWIPPGRWFVVDSCRIAKESAALHLLTKYGGKCECLVLTHQHGDHFDGFSELIEFDDWRFIGCNDLSVPSSKGNSRSPLKRLAGELDQAIAAIREAWQTRPNSTWWTWRGNDQRIDDTNLKVLHPPLSDDGTQPTRPTNLNQFSCPIMVEWSGIKVMLAADLQNPCWDEISTVFGKSAASEHCLLKVPHHGSGNALSNNWLEGSTNRLWIVTPWMLGSGQLPIFDDNGPVAQLLTHVDELYVTSLPTNSTQIATPTTVCRSDVVKMLEPNRGTFTLSKHVRGKPLNKYDGINSVVGVQIHPDGQKRVIACGAGSFCVVEERTEAV